VNKTLRILALVATLLSLPALADANDSKTFMVTLSTAETVTIDTGTASLTVNYNSSSTCSTASLFCAWYPTVIYSTNYATNRQLVATPTVTARSSRWSWKSRAPTLTPMFPPGVQAPNPVTGETTLAGPR